jgi:hypothetical protein
MSAESEIYRMTPTEGQHYYAILATRSYYDRQQTAPSGYKGDWRHFAAPTGKRYMGQYVSSGRAGSGDGMEYWEVYLKDGKHYELHYDYEGKTCLERVEPRIGIANDPRTPVPVDANIRLQKSSGK